MQEIFFTILVIWVLFKIFGSVQVKTYTFNQNNYNNQKKQEGEVKVESQGKVSSKARDDRGEYVDFEEVK